MDTPTRPDAPTPPVSPADAPPRRGGRPGRPRSPEAARRAERALTLHNQGRSYTEIAAALGCHRSHVPVMLRKARAAEAEAATHQPER